MSKRILVGLELSDYYKTSLEIAIEKAKHLNSTLAGIAIVDSEGIESSFKGAPPGAIEYSEKAYKHNLNLAEDRAQELIKSFEKECKKNDIKHESFVKIGNPAEKIINEARYYDIVIVGLKTHFNLEHPEGTGNTLKKLLKSGIVPTLAVPEKYPIPEKVIVCYDGSFESAKVMNVFAHLFNKIPFAKNIILLNINDNIEEGYKLLENAEKYLNLYSFNIEKEVKIGNPVKSILEIADKVDNPLIVLGSFGRSGLSQIFFGSTAINLIEKDIYPLFMYH